MSLIRFFRRRRWDRERARELESYLEIETQENLARGMSFDDAQQAARRKLGNPTLIREEIYWMNSIGRLEIVWRDLRYSARALGRSPGFTAVAILSLRRSASGPTRPSSAWCMRCSCARFRIRRRSN